MIGSAMRRSVPFRHRLMGAPSARVAQAWPGLRRYATPRNCAPPSPISQRLAEPLPQNRPTRPAATPSGATARPPSGASARTTGVPHPTTAAATSAVSSLRCSRVKGTRGHSPSGPTRAFAESGVRDVAERAVGGPQEFADDVPDLADQAAVGVVDPDVLNDLQCPQRSPAMTAFETVGGITARRIQAETRGRGDMGRGERRGNLVPSTRFERGPTA